MNKALASSRPVRAIHWKRLPRNDVLRCFRADLFV